MAEVDVVAREQARLPFLDQDVPRSVNLLKFGVNYSLGCLLTVAFLQALPGETKIRQEWQAFFPLRQSQHYLVIFVGSYVRLAGHSLPRWLVVISRQPCMCWHARDKRMCSSPWHRFRITSVSSPALPSLEA